LSGRPSTATPTPVTSAGYNVKTTDDANGNLEYFGESFPGALASSATWRIRKLTYTAGGNPSWLWAGGTDSFDKIFDNRASLVYS